VYGKSWGFKSAGALCSYPTPFSISWQNRKLSLNLGPVEAIKPAVEQLYFVTPKKKHHFDASDGEDMMSRIESNFADIHLRPVASKHQKKNQQEGVIVQSTVEITKLRTTSRVSVAQPSLTSPKRELQTRGMLRRVEVGAARIILRAAVIKAV
jgi:hypothetical protein